MSRRRAFDEVEQARRAKAVDQLADLPLGLGLPSDEPPIHQVQVEAHTRTLTGKAALEAKHREAERDLDARFDELLHEHPRVYELVEARTLALANGGETRISMKFVVELVRRELKVPVNNSFTSRFSRLLIEKHPHLRDLIELRTLKSQEAAA